MAEEAGQHRTSVACGAMTPDELDQVDRAAGKRGLTRSQFVRSACLVVAGLVERPAVGREVRRALAEARDSEPEEASEETQEAVDASDH